MKRFVIIALFFYIPGIAFSLTPNEYESVCIQAMKLIEAAIEPELPEGYFIVDKHSSSFGEVVNNQMFIRDCLIEKEHQEQFGQAYIFFYTKDSTFSKQFNNLFLNDIELEYPEFTIKLGLTSENLPLIEIIKNVIHTINFDNIEPIAF